MKMLTALLATALILVGPALAQTDDPEATVVEELIVRPSVAGPAWWRVSDADSVVHILGAPPAVTQKLAWDRSALLRRLEGANGLITPPDVRFGFPKVANAPLEGGLPPALRRRFARARDKLGQGPEQYDGFTPITAAFILLSEFQNSGVLSEDFLYDEVKDTALEKRVRHLLTYADFPPVRGRDKASELACLEGVLDQVDAGVEPPRAVAEGWARGDLQAALAAERAYDRCVLALDGGADFLRRLQEMEADAIAKALERPGHTVAILPLRPLVTAGGVLERLKARGFTVENPRQAEGR